ncbi:MAG: diguanylate cyclase [Zetaproteobacteria bacterium]|nr:diguanylate cyclase [Zetaproteobacteria bacterium]
MKQHFLYNVFENDSVGVIQMDINGYMKTVNHKFSEMVNFARDDLINQNFQYLVADEDRYLVAFLHNHLMHRIKHRNHRLMLDKRKNRPIVTHVSFALEFDEVHQEHYYIVIVQDMSELSSLTKELLNQKKILRDVIDHIDVHQAVIDRHWHYTSVNQLFARACSRSIEEIEGRHIRDVLPDHQYQQMIPMLQRCFQGEKCTWDQEFTLADQSVHYGVASLAPILNKFNEIDQCVLTTYDMTEQVLTQRALEKTKDDLQRLVHLDPMTQAFNRRYFMSMAEKTIASTLRNQDSLSVAMIDIDDFKSINDTFGHAVGDHVIITLAQQLSALTRTSDVVARLGGEEFAIILPRTQSDGAKIIAEKVRVQIEAHDVQINDIDFQFTISIGIAEIYLNIDTTIDTILHRADTALYYAKKHGKNQVIAHADISD